MLAGISRTYKPKDENGESQPSETKLVQVKVSAIVDRVQTQLTELFDIVLTQDDSNRFAIADVEVNGVVLLKNVPVTTLLFLEKQLIDIQTFIEKLPVLDPGEQWHLNPAQDCYTSEPFQTSRTKKILKSHVKYEATAQHPAQVETYNEDVTVGTWTTTKFSGAIPAHQKNGLLDRVHDLSNAVKQARETANSIEANMKKMGEAIFDFIFH